MKTNGSTHDHTHDDDLEEILSDAGPHLESLLDNLTGQYVGYEQMVGTLAWASMQAGLKIYNVSNTLDITNLERQFQACCVLTSWRPPHSLLAELKFFWPAEYTTLSLYGDEALCSLYHADHEPCLHQMTPAEPFTELEISYRLPQNLVSELESDEGIEQTAQRIQKVFSQMVDHKNMIHVEVKAVYFHDELRLENMKARYHWVIEEELRSLPLLSQALLSICKEVRQVLERFAAEFGANSDEDEQ